MLAFTVSVATAKQNHSYLTSTGNAIDVCIDHSRASLTLFSRTVYSPGSPTLSSGPSHSTPRSLESVVSKPHLSHSPPEMSVINLTQDNDVLPTTDAMPCDLSLLRRKAFLRGLHIIAKNTSVTDTWRSSLCSPLCNVIL